MIQLTIGQKDALDWGGARFRGRIELRPPGELRADIRGGVDEILGRAVGAEGERALGHWGAQPLPRGLAVLAPAVPLRQAAAGRGADQAETHRATGDVTGRLPCGGTGPGLATLLTVRTRTP